MTLKQERAWYALGSKKGSGWGVVGWEKGVGMRSRSRQGRCRKGQEKRSVSGFFFRKLLDSENLSFKRGR